jgi:hypothetical protein
MTFKKFEIFSAFLLINGFLNWLLKLIFKIDIIQTYQKLCHQSNSPPPKKNPNKLPPKYPPQISPQISPQITPQIYIPLNIPPNTPHISPPNIPPNIPLNFPLNFPPNIPQNHGIMYYKTTNVITFLYVSCAIFGWILCWTIPLGPLHWKVSS